MKNNDNNDNSAEDMENELSARRSWLNKEYEKIVGNSKKEESISPEDSPFGFQVNSSQGGIKIGDFELMDDSVTGGIDPAPQITYMGTMRGSKSVTGSAIIQEESGYYNTNTVEYKPKTASGFYDEIFSKAFRSGGLTTGDGLSKKMKKRNKTIQQFVYKESGTIVIDGKDYDISECVLIEGSYFLKSDKNILTDPLTGVLFHAKRANELYDSVRINSKGKMESTKKIYVTAQTYGLSVLIASVKYGFEGRILYPEKIEGWEYKEDPTRGVLVDHYSGDVNINDIKHYDQYKNIASTLPHLKGKIGDKSQTHLITEGIDYTFGVEIEVNRGNVPVWMAGRGYNMSCIRDGSINGGEGGPEFVTGVLNGDNGIKHLQDICSLLSKRCTIDKSCGVHIHLGGINFTQQFLVNSYKLALILENEIFSTLPKSRRENAYCKRLKKFNFKSTSSGTIEDKISLEEDYNMLFKYISYEKLNNPTFEYNKSSQHPMGPKCSYNHDTPRYCWLNYVPAMFDTRGNKSYSINLSHN